MNNAVLHSDSDDDNIDEKTPAQTELQYVRPKLLKSGNNQSPLDTIMVSQLQHTDFSIISLEIKILQIYLLTSVFDTDSMNYHDFFPPNSIEPNKENLLKYQKTDFAPKSRTSWLIDPSTSKSPRKASTNTSHTALSQYFYRFELLQMDVGSGLLFMSTYSEIEINPLAKTQICLPLKLLFTVLYKAHRFDISGHYVQGRIFEIFIFRFCSPELGKRIDLLIKDCSSSQTNKTSRMDVHTAPQVEVAKTAEDFIHRISMDTKVPIHPSSKGSSYNFVICVAFILYIITKPTP